jgi:monoamine oxidase
MKRREFLRTGVKTAVAAASVSVGGLSLVGCTTFDRLFSLERENLEDEVIIIGAGAAGLMAGFELKKKRIPFRIFEASSRVGGRVWSVEQGRELGSIAEMGAEFFEERHQILFALSRELNFETQEVEFDNKLEPLMLFAQGRWWPSRELRSKIRNSTAQIFRVKLKLLPLNVSKNLFEFLETPEAQGLDQVNVLDLWQRQRLHFDPVMRSYFEAQCLRNLGAGLSETSGLAWLLNFEKDERSRRLYRIVGGYQRLTTILFDRLSGVIPGYRVRFESPLSEIERVDEESYRLHFETPGGPKVYKTKYVIMALPFSQISKIKGLQNIHLGDSKIRAIAALRTSQPTKTVLSFPEAFWRIKNDRAPGNQGRWIGGSYFQGTWDSSWPGKGRGFQLSLLQIAQKFKDSSERQLNLGAPNNEMDSIVREISQLTTKAPKLRTEDVQSLNWGQQKFFGGDHIVYQPGQLTQFNPSIWTPEGLGRLQWAGEYTNATDSGTVAGALMSGLKAAQNMKEIYKFRKI